MFIQIDNEIINLDSVERFVFFQQEYRLQPACAIFLKGGRRIQVEGEEPVNNVKSVLQYSGQVVIVQAQRDDSGR